MLNNEQEINEAAWMLSAPMRSVERVAHETIVVGRYSLCNMCGHEIGDAYDVREAADGVNIIVCAECALDSKQ